MFYSFLSTKQSASRTDNFCFSKFCIGQLKGKSSESCHLLILSDAPLFSVIKFAWGRGERSLDQAYAYITSALVLPKFPIQSQ